MRILILTQYFPPEMGAPQKRLSALAVSLLKAGHQITVLTAFPNYPSGIIPEPYSGHLMLEEKIEDVNVLRAWIYATKNPRMVPRLLNYFSFVISSAIVGTVKLGQQDFIVVESPPLFLGMTGLLLSKIKGSKLVLNISDLWPESAVAMGIVKNKTIVALATWLEEFLYRQAHLITGQTQGIVKNIQSRFTDKTVALIPNGASLEGCSPPSLNNQEGAFTKEKLGIRDKFVIGYAGLHGIAQGLEVIIQTAQLLSDYRDLTFVFFGEGPEKSKLIHLSNQAKLDNIHFYPAAPSTDMPKILRLFDVAAIPLKRLDLFKGALPSKMFEAMASAIPLILAVDGEARTLVEKAQSGICVEPESPPAMAEAILKLYHDRAYSETLGKNGRHFVFKYYDRDKIAKDFERLLFKSAGEDRENGSTS